MAAMNAQQLAAYTAAMNRANAEASKASNDSIVANAANDVRQGTASAQQMQELQNALNNLKPGDTLPDYFAPAGSAPPALKLVPPPPSSSSGSSPSSDPATRAAYAAAMNRAGNEAQAASGIAEAGTKALNDAIAAGYDPSAAYQAVYQTEAQELPGATAAADAYADQQTASMYGASAVPPPVAAPPVAGAAPAQAGMFGGLFGSPAAAGVRAPSSHVLEWGLGLAAVGAIVLLVARPSAPRP